MKDHRIIGIYDGEQLREVRYVSVKPQPSPRRRFAALGWVALSIVIAAAVVACPSPSPAVVVTSAVRVAAASPAFLPQWLIDWIMRHPIGRRPLIRTSFVSAGTAS